MQHIEEQICEKIREFDVHALLRLLSFLGYQSDEIFFKSKSSLISPKSLLEKIEFSRKPMHKGIAIVIITVNMGLLSALSPLPSYFMKAIDAENIKSKEFIDFLEFFNHNLVNDYFNSIYPECNSSLYSNWEDTKHDYLRMLGLNSANFLAHIFELVFPELGVLVEKQRHKRVINAHGIRLGETIFDETCVFAGQAVVKEVGFNVTLYTDEEHTDKNVQWANEVALRLQDIIFPILVEVNINLEVILVIRTQKSWIELKKGRYLGIDKLRGGQEQNRVVIVFKGQVSNT